MPLLDLRREAQEHSLHLPSFPSIREAAVETWRGRMVNEYGSARVFEALARQLDEAGVSEALRDEVEAFASEERRHGILCGAVVEALGGEAKAVVPEPETMPAHEDAETPLEAALRNVLSVCCLSETVAVALIGAERLEMPEGELRNLLTTIYADEVGHSRFGWRWLASVAPSLDDSTRQRLGDYLEVAFEHLVRHELAHLPQTSEPPPEGAAYGLCRGQDARTLFFATVTDVIVPGLETLGLPARRAWDHAYDRLLAA